MEFRATLPFNTGFFLINSLMLQVPAIIHICSSSEDVYKRQGYDLSNMGKVKEIFEKQLEKCGVEYFDFYLFHNVCEMNIDAYLNEEYGIYPYLMQQKKSGRIRHLGFSAHGSYEVMKRFLDAYGDSCLLYTSRCV